MEVHSIEISHILLNLACNRYRWLPWSPHVPRAKAEQQIRDELTQYVRTHWKSDALNALKRRTDDRFVKAFETLKVDTATVGGKYVNTLTVSFGEEYVKMPVEDRAEFLNHIADPFKIKRIEVVRRLTNYVYDDDDAVAMESRGVSIEANGDDLSMQNGWRYIFYDRDRKGYSSEELSKIQQAKMPSVAPSSSSSSTSSSSSNSYSAPATKSSSDKKTIDTAIALLTFCADNPECQNASYRQLDIDRDGRITQKDLNLFKKAVGR